ncbi:MAG: prepilin peptidase [Acidobacteriaceae bacterium]|nr:prepilin peptidase [Acidobacteriaceae bacterium]MBV9778490.1 prepilin peptidase [Acidobacteriaceae bacterium]
MPNVLKVLLIAIVVIAGVYDLRFRRIPNWLNLSGVLLGIVINTAVFAEVDGVFRLMNALTGLKLAALGIGCALIVYVPLYLIRGMGAGDVKLMAAVGAIAGPWNWLCIFVATALLGGVVSLVFVAMKRRLHHTCANVGMIITELCRWRIPGETNTELDVRSPQSLGMPHGTLIALGAFAFLIISRGLPS